ncbi:protein SPT2 homolog [Triticum dicoccoides]|uniref:protein SPT2 homolog n=1 Tax=Triticum dicoccoides TaxID=85692 RepID=UPI001891B69E|nr:protein SPT2 homolog [Triticum dicoccoides]
MSRYEYETNGYHRAVEDEYEDEYYDEDEYEEEGAGAPEEDEEPPEGQQEFLQIRERLKEQIRRKAQGASASTAGRSSSLHDRRPPPPNFGSFFGPSKPVISQRVIEERKSMKEIQNTVPRERRPPGKDIPSSSRVQVQAKTNGFHQKQKIVNEAKKKAEALKDNRDYSFLLSDDADIPSPPREKPAARPSLTQKSDREVMHSAVKSRAPTSQPARLPNGHGLNNNTSSTQRRPESKFESKGKEMLLSRERAVDNGRMHSVVRNGSSQATGSKAASQKFPSKGQIANKPSMKEVNEQSLRKDHLARKQPVLPNGRQQPSQSQRMQSASYGQRPQQSLQSQRPQQSSQSQRPQQSSQSQRPQQSSQSQRPQQSSQSQRPLQSSQSQRPLQSQSQRPLQSSHSQRQLQSSQRERPLQSSQSQRPQSSQSQRPQQSLQRQRPQQSSQLQSSQSQRQLPQSNRPQQMLQRQRPLSSQGHYPEQRRVQANDRVKPSERQPSRQVSANGRDDRAKKKQLGKRRFDDDIEDEDDPMAMIRSMFRYDPSKYAGRDDDDSDMEADFATIEMEEKRSARIARQEDEKELRLLEEEERREQERKRRRVGR